MLALALGAALAQTAPFVLADRSTEEDPPCAYLGASAFDPTGNFLVLPHWDGAVTRLDRSAGAATLVTRGDWIHRAVTSSDGSIVIRTNDQGGVTAIDVSTGTSTAIADAGSGYGLRSLHVDATSGRAVELESVGSAPGRIKVYDVNGGTRTGSFAPGVTFPWDLFYPSVDVFEFLANDGRTLVAPTSTAEVVAVDVVAESTVAQRSGPASFELVALEADARKDTAVACWQGPAGDLRIERLDLPSLTPSMVLDVASGPGDVTRVVVDGDGDRLLVRGEELLWIDLALGSVFQIPLTDVQYAGIALTHDGARGILTETDELRLFDCATGTVLDQSPLRSGVHYGATRHPSLDLFSYITGDRCTIVDLTGATMDVTNASTAFGVDLDGSQSVAVDPCASRAVVAMSDSDAAWTLDLIDGTVGAPFPVGESPVDVHFADCGDVIVAHRFGRTLAAYDPESGAQSWEVALPGAPELLFSGATSSHVWAYVAEGERRALARVDLEAAVVDRAIPLPTVVSPILVLGPDYVERSVAVDASLERACFHDWATGELHLIDLVSGAVIDTWAGIPLSPGVVDVDFSPSRDRVAVHAPEQLVVLSVTPGGFQVLWELAVLPFGTKSVYWLGEDVLIAADISDAGRCVDAWTGAALPSSAPLPAIRDAVVYGEEALLFTAGSSESLTVPVRWDATSAEMIVDHPVFVEAAGPIAGGFYGQGGLSSGHERYIDLGGQPAVMGLNGDAWVIEPVDLAGAPSQRTCAPAPTNAWGDVARIDALGMFAAGGALTLRTSGLEPNGSPSLVLVATAAGPPRPVLASGRSLCISGSYGRVPGSIGAANAAGTRVVELDLDALPIPGYSAALPGDSLTFQTWYRDRDAGGAATDNASDALTVTLR